MDLLEYFFLGIEIACNAIITVMGIVAQFLGSLGA